VIGKGKYMDGRKIKLPPEIILDVKIGLLRLKIWLVEY